MCEFEVTGPWL